MRTCVIEAPTTAPRAIAVAVAAVPKAAVVVWRPTLVAVGGRAPAGRYLPVAEVVLADPGVAVPSNARSPDIGAPVPMERAARHGVLGDLTVIRESPRGEDSLDSSRRRKTKDCGR